MSARRRVSAVLAPAAALALAAGLLTACSGDGDDAYCEALVGAKKELSGLVDDSESGGAGSDVLGATLDLVEGLREKSPEELRDEWDTVTFAYQDLADAVDEAGVDLAEVQGGDRPDGVSQADWQHLRAVASKLLAPRVVDASRGIEDQAREVCDVDLDL